MIRVMSIQSKIVGTGGYLPDRILTNQDLEKMVDTSDAWIRERTGITERRLAAVGEGVSDMALHASRRALEMAELGADKVDAIIFATVTADQPMPSAACMLQAKLGCRPIMAFDVSAACTGYVYSLSLADAMIKSGQVKTVLVVGAEKLSSIVNFKDRETCILFGDAAGCAVVAATDEKSDTSSRFLGFHLRANGALGDLLTLESSRPRDPHQMLTQMDLPFVHMKGREVFKSAVRGLAESCVGVLKANGMTQEDVDWFIPHQANIRIIQAVGESLSMPAGKTIINIEKTGNVSSATIPIAFDEAVRDGRIKRGHKILFTAFGAGLTYGASLFTF